MNFYKAQDEAHKKTKILIFYYGCAIVGTVIAMHLAMSLIRVQLLSRTLDEKISFVDALIDWRAFGIVGVVTTGVILSGWLYKRLQISNGGSAVASALGGRPIDPDTRDPEERQLVNVVEEMAIASGMPVPQVWVMDEDGGINAFAAGTEPGNAVIGVTRGTLQRLNRAELQGVIAHEFSHILNGDMKMNIRLMCMLHGLLLITIIGYTLLRIGFHTGGSRKKEGGTQAIGFIGIAMIIVGAVGAFCASLIQSAISRQREYLADASAVEFTMDPAGISGALKKIGGTSLRSRVSAPAASEMEHMFFAPSGLFTYGLASHPPLEERIEIIEPDWDGQFLDSSPRRMDENEEIRHQQTRTAAPNPMDIFGSVVTAGAMLDDIGDSSQTRIQKGQAIVAGLNRAWIDACHDKYQSQLLIYGMLMADDKKLQDRELQHIQSHLGSQMSELVLTWYKQMAEVQSSQKIALVDLCIPTLRRLTGEEHKKFIDLTQWLIRSDNNVDLFEFMLQKLIERHLDVHFHGARKVQTNHRTLNNLGDQMNVIISTMAGVGANSEQELHAAYKASVDLLTEYGVTGLSLLPPAECGLAKIDKALEQIEHSTPMVKKQVLMVCGRAVMHDGQVTNREAELIRAVADAIGCTVPPFVNVA